MRKVILKMLVSLDGLSASCERRRHGLGLSLRSSDSRSGKDSFFPRRTHWPI